MLQQFRSCIPVKIQFIDVLIAVAGIDFRIIENVHIVIACIADFPRGKPSNDLSHPLYYFVYSGISFQ